MDIAHPGRSAAEGLRERKKRTMRHQLSDAATRMFLERGFDAVRVADVAEACGVSEKTVYNYFPTKEALLLDRLESTAGALRTYLADPALSPVAAMLKVLDHELDGVVTILAADPDPDQAIARYGRFGDLIRDTPSLRAYRSDTSARFTDVAAEVLAARSGLQVGAPETQVAAAALLGLWRVQIRSLRTHLYPGRSLSDVIDTVAREVRRAAVLIERGLATFPARTPTGQNRTDAGTEVHSHLDSTG